jgi:hypothetical protein
MLLIIAVIFTSLILILVALADSFLIRFLLTFLGLSLFFVCLWLIELHKDKKNIKREELFLAA